MEKEALRTVRSGTEEGSGQSESEQEVKAGPEAHPSIASFGRAIPEVQVDGITFSRICYKTIKTCSLNMNVFWPKGIEEGERRTCILFFHGGGWTGGSPAQLHPQAVYFASRGAVAISARYRLAGKPEPSPRLCLLDAKSAVRYVRSHADGLRIDPDRIVAGGSSAGAQLAAACGTGTTIEDDSDDKTVSPRPNALILFNPVFNNGPPSDFGRSFGYERVKDFYGEFSPMHNIDRETPPTCVLSGTEDKALHVDVALKYKQIMEDLGRTCELHVYKGYGHGFFNFGKYDQKPFRATAHATDRFLVSVGLLEGEPTIGMPSEEIEEVDPVEWLGRC
jgi:acetyl esterase/lipase